MVKLSHFLNWVTYSLLGVSWTVQCWVVGRHAGVLGAVLNIAALVLLVWMTIRVHVAAELAPNDWILISLFGMTPAIPIGVAVVFADSKSADASLFLPCFCIVTVLCGVYLLVRDIRTRMIAVLAMVIVVPNLLFSTLLAHMVINNVWL